MVLFLLFCVSGRQSQNKTIRMWILNNRLVRHLGQIIVHCCTAHSIHKTNAFAWWIMFIDELNDGYERQRKLVAILVIWLELTILWYCICLLFILHVIGIWCSFDLCIPEAWIIFISKIYRTYRARRIALWQSKGTLFMQFFNSKNAKANCTECASRG